MIEYENVGYAGCQVARRSIKMRTIGWLRSPWLAKLRLPFAGVSIRDYENESFVFVRCTPNRPKTLRSPPPLRQKKRVVEEENVTEESAVRG